MMDIRACLFDLDGVIVDTAKFHFLAWKKLAAGFNFELLPEHDEKLKGISRMTALDVILNLAGRSISSQEKTMLADQKNRWYVEYISTLNEKDILPGVISFIDELKSLEIKIAIGSASKNAKTILYQIGIIDRFDAIIDGTKVSKAKPDPEVFLRGAEELLVAPDHCVVFEDAAAGIDAAKNAEMYSIGVGDPIILHHADVVIGSFNGVRFDTLLTSLENAKKGIV